MYKNGTEKKYYSTKYNEMLLLITLRRLRVTACDFFFLNELSGAIYFN